MSAITTPISHGLPHDEPEHGDNYLNHEKGLMSWLFTLDHKRIGLMYLYGVLTAFFIGGFFAVALRTHLLHPHQDLTADQGNLYNNMFTLHGAVMVFMFIIPAIPAVLGNFVLPLMLGAKDVAFPRLNLLSFWLYCLGGSFFLYVLASGVVHAASGGQITLPGGWGLDTGWTFYTPYSTSKAMGSVVAATFGAFILGFSSILTGLNFIASIHSLRPPGMTWFRMPLMLWALYATSIIQILATPVLAITLLLLIAEKTLGIGIFDAGLGGDPVLYQHFFWFYSHPAVYIMILPAMGVISEVITAHSRKHIFGYSFVAMSSVGIALLSFFVWGHHMFVSGQSPLAGAIFSFLTFLVALPSAVKVFNWLATLYKADIHLTTPMLYVLGFILLFTIGGLTGLPLAAVNVDVHLHDTYFVIAHFHYVAMGSMLFAFLAGMNHWFPKMFGRMCNDTVGKLAAVIIFVGFNLTFFPQFIAGTHGMPRRYASYPVEFQKYMVLSSIGAFTMSTGLIIVGLNWLHGVLWGKKAPANPWGANTLEWQTTSPPPHDNFKVTPIAGDPYDMEGWIYDPKIEGWVPNPDYQPVPAQH